MDRLKSRVTPGARSCSASTQILPCMLPTATLPRMRRAAARRKIWIRVSPHHRRAVGTDAASSRRDGICNGKRQGLCKSGIRTGLESSCDLTNQLAIFLSNTVRTASPSHGPGNPTSSPTHSAEDPRFVRLAFHFMSFTMIVSIAPWKRPLFPPPAGPMRRRRSPEPSPL